MVKFLVRFLSGLVYLLLVAGLASVLASSAVPQLLRERWLPLHLLKVEAPSDANWIHFSGDPSRGSNKELWPYQVAVPQRNGVPYQGDYFVAFKTPSGMFMRTLLPIRGMVAFRIGPGPVAFMARTRDGQNLMLDIRGHPTFTPDPDAVQI